MPLNTDDKERLGRISDFLQTELKDLGVKFTKINYKVYASNSDTRRNLERCIENIVNASLDIAKIILINENLPIPDSYREYFLALYTVNLIDEKTANVLADGTRLRNILAHQYLDIRWDRIKEFLSTGYKAYEEFLNFAKKKCMA